MKSLLLGIVLVVVFGVSSSYYLKYDVDPEDDAFLEQLEKASFLFFWEQADPISGQIRDRSLINGEGESRPQSSIASTGLGLAALAIAHQRNWMDRAKLEERVTKTLDFILNKLDSHNGFFYHFVDVHSGKRMWNSELSSIDTAIIISGVLTVRSYFKDNESIQKTSTQIYERVDYKWMLNNGTFPSMGWFPEKGFIQDSWNRYCELMMLLLQGIGSPTHPTPLNDWFAFKRNVLTYKNISFYSNGEPLFVHQFSHAWIDFYNNSDYFTDYFENSVNATKAHKLWCITDLAADFSVYNEDYWGISTSDSRIGYTGWGGPPASGPLDGSVVPSALAGSIPFLPKETLHVLKKLKENYPKSFKKYGFTDAFNPTKNWYDPDVVGIDTGTTLLMAENYRSGFVWEQMMKNEEIVKAMKLVGFDTDKPGWATL